MSVKTGSMWANQSFITCMDVSEGPGALFDGLVEINFRFLRDDTGLKVKGWLAVQGAEEMAAAVLSDFTFLDSLLAASTAFCPTEVKN